MIGHSIAQYIAEHWLEDAGFLTTLFGIWLTTKRSMMCWPVILASDAIYLLVFYHELLLSDALLQIFFLAFTFYGWWHWWRGARDEGEVCVAPLSMRNMWLGLVAGAAGSLILAYFANRAHAALPYLDATLASYSLVASWWGARKYIANWWLWIAVDILYVPEYLYKDMKPTALLYAGLVVLAVLGLRDWRKAPVAQAAELQETV